MTLIIPYTFQPGTVALANQVNANFQAVKNETDSLNSRINSNTSSITDLSNTKANINGDEQQVFQCADPSSGYDAVNKQSLNNAISNSVDYISGFNITKDGNSSIIVSSGSCYDTTHTKILSLSDSISKDNVDQLASTTYYVYIIGSTKNANVDINITTSSSQPSYPSGYNIYRKIGKFTTNENNSIGYIYGISQNSNISSELVLELFSLLYPNMSKAQADFPTAVWNNTTGQETTINKHYILSAGYNWKVSCDGYINWVCNEQTNTQDLKIGEAENNMITVARVRSAAGDDATGTAAFIPIRKGMYVSSSKSNMYFYPLRGV